MRGPIFLVGDDLALFSPFVRAGVLEAADVHLASLIARTVVGVEPEVLLGAAFAARAVRLGHVCILIGSLARSVVVDEVNAVSTDSLPWPDPEHWGRLLAASPAVRRPDDREGETILPLVFDGTRLYLERYWRFEERIAEDDVSRGADDPEEGPASPPLHA